MQPPADLDDEALVDYAMAISGQAVAVGDTAEAAVLIPDRLGTRSLADHEGFVDDVGFSLLEVDRYVERSTVPDTVTVLDGAFDGGSWRTRSARPTTACGWSATPTATSGSTR